MPDFKLTFNGALWVFKDDELVVYSKFTLQYTMTSKSFFKNLKI